ncbi:hypothetical protein FO519_002099 [Halicephalobus sp. NKZ332]|nr:hypothetical protein FO519_002099 [Halicephalobus sp. NKZ332]
MVGKRKFSSNKKRDSSDDEQGGCPCGSKGSRYWICCDGCETWYHGKCAGFTEKETNMIDKFYCQSCRTASSNQITYKPGKDPKKLKLDSGEVDSTPSTPLPPNDVRDMVPDDVEEVSAFEQQGPSGLPIFIPKDIKPCNNCPGCSRTSDCNKCVNCHEKRGMCIRRVCNNALTASQLAEREIEEEAAALERTVERIKKTDKTLIFGKKPVRPRLSNNTDVVQCHGPGCTRTSREGSHYCSHACGLNQARRRLLLVLPFRARGYGEATPESTIEYQEVVRKTSEEYNKLQENLNYLLSVKNLFINYLDQIASCKPEEKKEDEKKHTSQSDENDSEDADSEEQKEECAFFGRCSVCGMTHTSYAALHKHVTRCYNRITKRTFYCGPDPEPYNPENIICDAYCKTQNAYCKRLRLTCADHYKGALTNHVSICGAPRYMDREDFAFDFARPMDNLDDFFSMGYCSTKKEECEKHLNWAQLFLGSIDNYRLGLLRRMEVITEDYSKARRQYYKKFDVCDVIQNYTITKDTDRYGMPKDIDFVYDIPEYIKKNIDWSPEIDAIDEKIQEKLKNRFIEAERKKEAEKARKEAMKKTRAKKKVTKKKTAPAKRKKPADDKKFEGDNIETTPKASVDVTASRSDPNISETNVMVMES